MSAVINDSRNTIQAITNQPGTIIYSYIQGQIAKIVPGVLVYRITTDQGNLSGFCAIQVQNNVASLLFYQFRPAAQPFSATILQIISSFIIANIFLQDMLY
jgi:hypothetical protein